MNVVNAVDAIGVATQLAQPVTNPPGALDCLSDLEPLALPPGYEDAEVILSISGGKDSAAAALRLRASGIAFRAVFADTGWEAKETYAHLETMERVLGQPIERVRASKSMREKILERAGFPGRSERWCTRELKVEVLRAYHDRVIDETGRDTLSVVGIRAEESAERAALPVFEFSNEWGGAVWRPVRDLSIAQVLALHHRHAMPLNPLYLRGHNRVGCWPCVYAGKEEIALIAEHDPARIDVLRSARAQLDADIAASLAELRGFEERLTPHEKGLCRVALSAAAAGQNVLVPMPAAGGLPPLLVELLDAHGPVSCWSCRGEVASAAETYCLHCRAQGKVEVPRG